MAALLAIEGGKRTFDDARTEAQTTGRQQCLGLAQVGQQAFAQAGQVERGHDGQLIAGGVQHVQSMSKAETIRIQVGLQGRLMHPGPHGIMCEQQPIEFLIEHLWRFAAQGLRAESLMGFDFIDDQFDLRALMIQGDQVESRSELGIKQGGDQPMHR